MFKNKTIKLFLMLGVILFSLIGVVGCSNPTVSVNVNATYIRTHFEDDEGNSKFTIVNNHIDLVSLLENDTPEKYNEDFFETKFLLFFKIVESSDGNKSEIESYIINDKTLNVYVKTKQYGDTADMECWWFILELKNNEFDNYGIIKIFKNGNEIIKDTKSNSLNQTIYYQSYSFDEVGVWPDFIGNEYNLSFKERRYHFILSFDELVAIFEKSIGSNIDNYFNSNIFDANVILCVVRDETSGTANIKYSNFRVNDSKFSIKENFIYGGALVVSRYLDFVIIPKKLFINGNYNLQYYQYYNE